MLTPHVRNIADAPLLADSLAVLLRENDSLDVYILYFCCVCVTFFAELQRTFNQARPSLKNHGLIYHFRCLPNLQIVQQALQL